MSLAHGRYRFAADHDVIAAVTMPARLGADVLAVLRMRMIAGPVFVTERDHLRWTFLAGPSIALRRHVYAELAQWQVGLADIDAPFLAALSTQVVAWIEPQSPGRELPPWSSVIATVRAVRAR